MQNMETQIKTALAKAEPKESKLVEYVPFGADEAIKLSVKIVQDLICIPTKSGKLCSERDAMKFIMLCKARGLNPFEGDSYLQGYDGRDGAQFSLITAHQAFLKRAELHPEYDGMESGVVVVDGEENEIERQGDFYRDSEELIGGWARVHFKTRKIPMYRKLRLATFKKGYGVWENNPEGMIVKCAEADALRSSFPTKLGGLYLSEEQFKDNDHSGRFKNAKPAQMLETSSEFLPETTTIQEPARVDQPSQEAPSPQAQLIEFITSQGYTFEDLCFWSKAGGHIENAKITPEEFPAEVAQRLLRAKTGMLKGLKDFKAEAQ